MSIDTISKADEISLALVRGYGPNVLTDIHPRDPILGEIKAEVERHVPGYNLRVEYGLFSGTRGCRLSLFPDEITVQDAFYDGFESYFGKQHPEN